jgi:hypothetical protein
MQVGWQGGDDVVERLGHRGEGIVGSEDDVIAAEDLDRRVQGLTVVGQTVGPQSACLATRQFG